MKELKELAKRLIVASDSANGASLYRTNAGDFEEAKKHTMRARIFADIAAMIFDIREGDIFIHKASGKQYACTENIASSGDLLIKPLG